MNISQRGLDFIKRKEELFLASYKDVAGNWTVGYGHCGPPAAEFVIITSAQALDLLKKDVAKVEAFINTNLSIHDQDQFDALTSLIFNIGTGNFQKSLTCSMIKSDPNNPAIAFEWIEFISSGGKKYRGLLLRRLEELQMYFQ